MSRASSRIFVPLASRTGICPDSVWTRALYADDLILQGRVAEAAAIYQQIGTLASPAERAVFAATLRRTGESSTSAEPGALPP